MCELGNELWSSITGDGSWKTEMFDPMMDEEFCEAFRCEGGVGRNKDSLFGGFVNNNKNGVIRIRLRERGDKVEGNVLEGGGAGIDWV